jgi:beta-glucosidase
MASDRAAEIEYADGIWVGYRHFLTRQAATAYPFGFGLSYTEFAYGDLKLNSNVFTGTLAVAVTITNSGKTAGREAVQLYLSAPAGALPKPSMELKAFGKTRLLQPGESQTLSFDLLAYDLASFDPAGSAWQAEAGEYTVHIGASATDIRRSQRFQLPESVRIQP